jgi:hypothetical protein
MIKLGVKSMADRTIERNGRCPWWIDERCLRVTLGRGIVDGLTLIRALLPSPTRSPHRSDQVGSGISEMSPTLPGVNSIGTISCVSALTTDAASAIIGKT